MRRSIAFLCRHFVTVPLSKRIEATRFIFHRRSRLECRFTSEARRPRPSLANEQSISRFFPGTLQAIVGRRNRRGSAKRPPGVSLVYSPMAYIMSPVISLKEPVENFGCGRGSFREPFRGEVGGYNWRLAHRFV